MQMTERNFWNCNCLFVVLFETLNFNNLKEKQLFENIVSVKKINKLVFRNGELLSNLQNF